MWTLINQILKNHYDLGTTLIEFMESTTRRLVLVCGSALFVSLYLPMIFNPEGYGWSSLGIMLIILGTTGLSIWMIDRNFLFSIIIFQAGISLSIILLIWHTRQTSLLFLVQFFPLILSFVIGLLAGLLSELAVFGLLYFSYLTNLIPSPADSFTQVILLSGLASMVLGWLLTREMIKFTSWVFQYYVDARSNLEAARDQRLELRQIQDDLVHANREMARLTQHLKFMNQVAEEARRIKEEFVSNVSHELRTPLNMIIGFSEMIAQSPNVYGKKLPPSLLSDIAIIRRNSLHLSKLVDDVLDLSQIEAQRMTLNKEISLVPDMIDTAVTVTRPLFTSKGLSLKIEVENNLPLLFCDKTRINQVLINLLSNAGRFTENGGITVTASRVENEIIFCVADTGPGLTSEEQKKLFEPFAQVDKSIYQKKGGTGLGLNISRRFIEMHDGKIWLVSEPGVGTMVNFSLPVPLVEMQANSESSGVKRWINPYALVESRSAPYRFSTDQPSESYVVLEKGDTLRRIFEHGLEGIDIFSVRSFPEARDALSHTLARALVINSAGFVDGELDENITKELPFNTPTISCWLPMDETTQSLGVSRYLIKPVNSQTLLSAVRSLGEGIQKILVVDDEPDIIHLFRRILVSCPEEYTVVTCGNGRDALAYLQESKPDAILLDLIMSGMSGFEFLQKIKQMENFRHIPVIVVSSKDPGNQPIVSNQVRVSRAMGFSTRELLDIIKNISQVVSAAG